MIDKPPRKPCFITLVIVGILSFIAGVFVGSNVEKIPALFKGEDGDTPIIVRDGSIVITSLGQDLNGFSSPDPKVLIHPRINARLGKLKVDGQLKGSPCANTKKCGVEFVWSTGTPGQDGYREYTVVVGSNSGGGRTAGIVSSVPFSQYQASHTTDSTTGRTAFTYKWSPAGTTLTFREARLHTTPVREVSPRPAPQIICSNPGCRVEFEYK